MPVNHVANKNKSNIIDYSFHQTANVSTVVHNTSFFSKKEIAGADHALELQKRLGWPTTNNFKHYVRNNLPLNCDVTIDDIDRAISIYGKLVPLIKGGRLTRNKPTPIKDLPLPERLPNSIMKQHR